MEKRKTTSTSGGIKKSIFRILLLGGAILGLLKADKANITNAFFSDLAMTENNRISAGVWVPTLTMKVEPENPNGKNGWYVSQPCVKLFSDLDNVTIYYSLVGEEGATPETAVDEGVCVLIPEGKHTIYAWAENNLNPNWVSQTISQSFKVDTQCPLVKITNPEDGETLGGEIEIKGTVEDENPHHYWLVIENEEGNQVAGPGVVLEEDSFSDASLFNWNSENFEDGNYIIKLEARDEAGNKCPNLAPVPDDPEIEGDSVDWIEVKIGNQAEPAYQEGDILINEVMWTGSSAGSQDEWIELYNTTDKEIDLKGWKLENVRKSAGNPDYSFPASLSILANSYLVLANSPENSANTALGVAVDVSNANLELDDIDYGKIILRDPTGQLIDEADASGSWPGGEIESADSGVTYYRSMQRNQTNPTSWCTAKDESLNDTTYWKTEGFNYGSPKGANVCGEADDSGDGSGDQEQPIGDGSEENEKPAYLGQIVINEFLPNPVGDDNAPMPGGEWVELYNKSSNDIDVAGWYLYDEYDNHELEITASNSDNNGNPNDSGETIIPAHGWLVVYRNGDSDFSLNNDKDTIRLFDGKIGQGGILIDSYSYSGRDYSSLTPTPGAANGNDQSGLSGNQIPQGKSFVRFPDGSDNWIDPVPTPGKKNSDEDNLKAFQEYYEPLCFNDDKEPICDVEFMYSIGLLEKTDKKLEKEEVAEIPTGEELLEEKEGEKSPETKDEAEKEAKKNENENGSNEENDKEDKKAQAKLEMIEDGPEQGQTADQVSGPNNQLAIAVETEKTTSKEISENPEKKESSVQDNDNFQAKKQSGNTEEDLEEEAQGGLANSNKKEADDNSKSTDHSQKEVASLKSEEENEEEEDEKEDKKLDKKDEEKDEESKQDEGEKKKNQESGKNQKDEEETEEDN